MSKMSYIGDAQDISIEKNITVVKSAEELERLTVDERLQPIERAVYLLSSGQEVQRISVITSLPELLEENHAECMRRIVPKIREVVRVADAEMQLASCNVFVEILQRNLVPIQNYTQTFLQTILMCMESKDADISKVWLDTLLEVIDLLPKDIVYKEILRKAVAKGQLSQSIQSRLASCRILGKAVTKFEPYVIKQDILPVVLALCQDVEFEVRACMSRLLEPVARGLGLEETKSSILPALVELTNDDHNFVRLAGLDTIISILTLLDSDAQVSTVIPVVTKYCQQAFVKQDETLSAMSRHFGNLCQGLEDNLTDEQRKYFIEFYRKLCRIGTSTKKSSSERSDGIVVANSSAKSMANKPPLLAILPGMYDVKDQDQNDELDTCRQHAAANFPAMVAFVGPKSFRLELALPFSQLCSDVNYRVRETIASGFHEVAIQLGNLSHLLLSDLIGLLNDNSVEVLRNGFIRMLPETLDLVYQSCASTNMEAKFAEVLPAVLSCEVVVFACNNWRLQEDFMRALSCLTVCFPSDVIHDQIVHLLFRKLQLASALPVKRAAVHALLLIMRSNRRQEQRLEICRRLVDAFFKEHFMEALLGLYDDGVPNIRLRLCRLLPQVKRTLRLPQDRALNDLLESCVRKLSINERDMDVKNVLRRVVYEMDRLPLLMESHSAMEEEDELDQRKEDEEQRLLELEDLDRRNEEDKMRADRVKDKQAGNKLPAPKKGMRPVMSPHVTASVNKAAIPRSATPPGSSRKAVSTATTRGVAPGSAKVASSRNSVSTAKDNAASTAASTTHAVGSNTAATRKISTPAMSSVNSTTASTAAKPRASTGAIAAPTLAAAEKKATQRRISIGSPYPLDKKK